MNQALIDSPQTETVKLSVGIVLLPRFTLLPFAAFVDCLRLSADRGDTSRPVNCRWDFMTVSGEAAQSSCGARISPCTTFQSPKRFDYLVVCGGLLPRGRAADRRTLDYLREAASVGVPLVGLCTGPFALIEAGLMRNRQCCVSWFHFHDLTSRFPDVAPVADRLFVVDGDRITCSGGVAAADLAAWMVERHLGRAWAQKSMHIMLIDRPRSGNTAQPQPTLYDRISDNRVRRALLLIEQRLSDPIATPELASMLSMSRRQLERLFRDELDMSPSQFSRTLRLRYGYWLLRETDRSTADISTECGFTDSAHFSRRFRELFECTPASARQNTADKTKNTSSAIDEISFFENASQCLSKTL
ncbi:MAG: GlxA family transcriptional regulator [Salinisphaera sp.]|uniref:GlxA family transcriptional regulator n=1 Tax=Salinisphaera sp. TaxID=1914330 RepID=UPI003C7AC3AB